MDPPHACQQLRPCLLHHPHHHLHHHHLHHHHHHHSLFLHHHHHHCRHHRHHHHHHIRPNFTSFAQNPQHHPPVTLPTPTSGLNDAYSYNPNPQVLQKENTEDVASEEEDDDDPIFVLTDEWKEFFAKSEAKRKLERKQAKKGKK